MKIEFDEYKDQFGDRLCCPNCKESFLHHRNIEVFDYDENDVPIHVSVADGVSKVDSNVRDNPSARRNGMKIHFDCEMCNAKPFLKIYQHKGQTCFEIDFDPVVADE